MKQFIIGVILTFFAMQLVQAAGICDAKLALADARLNLMMMVISNDTEEQDALKIDIDTASMELEKVLKIMLKDENHTDDTQLTTLQKTWIEFKNTRESKIIPAISAGNNAKAMAIATGIQAKRMKLMNHIIQALNGDNCN
jgi:predicted helicase